MKITLRYVVEDVDRHGNVRIYVRPPGRRKVRIREMPGSEAFMRAYHAALAGGNNPVITGLKSGSFAALCFAYYTSPEWRRLDRGTQEWRRRHLDRICEECGAYPVAGMDARAVKGLRNEEAARPTVANQRLAALKALFAWAIEADAVRADPTQGVKPISYHSDGHHTWTIEDVTKYEARHPIGTRARLAMALLLYTAGRREDAVRLGPQHCRNGRVRFTQAKNEHRKPIQVDLPLSLALDQIIRATPTGHLAFLVTEYGQPFSAGGFGNKMRRWCDQAGLPQCSAHGLRKAAATRLAEAGATVEEIMAITGHQTVGQVGNYTRKANRALMADHAMAKLNRERSSPISNIRPSPTDEK